MGDYIMEEIYRLDEQIEEINRELSYSEHRVWKLTLLLKEHNIDIPDSIEAEILKMKRNHCLREITYLKDRLTRHLSSFPKPDERNFEAKKERLMLRIKKAEQKLAELETTSDVAES